MTSQSTQPIGVFDSGLGGLCILSALKNKMPEEQFIYVGDTAHLPYGDKSEGTLKEYVGAIFQFLKHKNCKFVVVACNSAATVIHKMDNLPFAKDQIIEVITPIVNLIGSQKKYKNIGIIGTRKTISSGMFNEALLKKNPALNITAKATPLLVPMIEDGFIQEHVLKPIFDRYFKGFESCELIIPACTHYPILYSQIENYFNHGLKVLHTPKIIAETLDYTLRKQTIFNEKRNAEDEYYLSDITPEFLRESKLFLGEEVDFSHVSL
jgi:glutamate racemase